MARSSLTAATQAYLRTQGWVGDLVERRQGPISRDYLGWADWCGIKAVTLGAGPIPLRALAVQITSASNASKRLAKMRACPGLTAWLEQGGEAWLLSWGMKGPVVTVVETRHDG